MPNIKENQLWSPLIKSTIFWKVAIETKEIESLGMPRVKKFHCLL